MRAVVAVVREIVETERDIFICGVVSAATAAAVAAAAHAPSAAASSVAASAAGGAAACVASCVYMYVHIYCCWCCPSTYIHIFIFIFTLIFIFIFTFIFIFIYYIYIYIYGCLWGVRTVHARPHSRRAVEFNYFKPALLQHWVHQRSDERSSREAFRRRSYSQPPQPLRVYERKGK